jgi:hypothetical protein
MVLGACQAVQQQQAAADLAYLSGLSSLQEVELAYEWQDDWQGGASVQTMATAASAAATAWSAARQVLPLTSLALRSVWLPVSVLQQALPLQTLSTLQLASRGVIALQRVAPAALTSLLQHATALQQLQLECHLDCSTLTAPQGLGGGQLGDACWVADAERVGSIARLLRAVCSLPVQEAASVKLGVQLSEAAVGRLFGILHHPEQQLPVMQRYLLIAADRVLLEF